MESLISTFHISGQAILAQMVNFIIVLVILWNFALKPLMKIMNERTKTIEKSLVSAKEIEENLLKAKQEIGKLVNDAKEQINFEKENMIVEAKKEVANVVTLSLEKILTKGVTAQLDQKIVKQSFEE